MKALQRVLRLPELRTLIFNQFDVASLAVVVCVNTTWFDVGAPLLWRDATLEALQAVAPARIPVYDGLVASLNISVDWDRDETDATSQQPPFDDAWRLPRLTKLHCLYVTILGTLLIAVPVVKRCAATLETVIIDESPLCRMIGEEAKDADMAVVRRRRRDSALWAALAHCPHLRTLCLMLPLTAAALERAREAIVRDGGAPCFVALSRFAGQVKTHAVPALCGLLPNLTHLRLVVDDADGGHFPIDELLARLPRLQVLSLLGDVQTVAPEPYAGLADDDEDDAAYMVGDADAAPDAPHLRMLHVEFVDDYDPMPGTATPRQFLRALLPKLPALRELRLGPDAVPPSTIVLIGKLAPTLVTLDFGGTCNLQCLASATTCPLFPKLRVLKVANLRDDDIYCVALMDTNTENEFYARARPLAELLRLHAPQLSALLVTRSSHFGAVIWKSFYQSKVRELLEIAVMALGRAHLTHDPCDNGDPLPRPARPHINPAVARHAVNFLEHIQSAIDTVSPSKPFSSSAAVATRFADVESLLSGLLRLAVERVLLRLAVERVREQDEGSSAWLEDAHI